MDRVKLVFKYLLYKLNAKSKFDVHSPFLFNFLNDVLPDLRTYYAFDEIESARKQLLNDPTLLIVEDFGAGSKHTRTPERKISDIAKNTLIPEKFGRLLFRIVDYYRPKTILEMGTSLGISGLYLAKASIYSKVVTLEGSPSIASFAADLFRKAACENIQIITGEFSTTLPKALNQLQTIDLAFIDGNHRRDPTILYFESILPYTHAGSIIIFDDIHWSVEMEEAWEKVRNHPAVTLSIDMFFKGIVFFNPDIKTSLHITIEY